MNEMIRSPFTKILAIIVGYVAALMAAMAVSVTYRQGFLEIFGSTVNIPPLVSLSLFVACACLLCASVWRSQGKASRPWHKVDYCLLVILTLYIIYLCYYMALRIGIYYPFFPDGSSLLLLFSMVAYGLGMFLIGETSARLRDKTLARSLYWVQFFRRYPPYRPAGLAMAFLLVGALASLILLRPNVTLEVYYDQTPLPTIHQPFDLFWLALFALALIALTCICSFVLSLSAEYEAKYEKATSEKIQAERFKAELITNVSHDIRTPLTAIISYVNLLKALPVKREDFQDYVKVLDKKAARLKTLTSDLMEASKAATGNVVVDISEIDLVEIVGQIVGEFDDQFAERDLTVVFRQPDGQVLVKADSGHLWRVLENLFGNAAKYALAGTRVFVDIAQHDGRTTLSLKNTSQEPIDLPADSLTEQFIRGDRSRQTDGSGLGLYIAKSLMELMGGTFTIRATGDLFEAELVF